MDFFLLYYSRPGNLSLRTITILLVTTVTTLGYIIGLSAIIVHFRIVGGVVHWCISD